MTRYFLCLLLAAAFFYSASASDAVEPQPNEASSFTNKDLEQYKHKSQEGGTPKALQGVGGNNSEEKHAKSDKNKDQEYWCSKGRQLRKKLDMSRDEVNALKELSNEFRETEASSSGKKKLAARKNVRKNEKNVVAAQRRLKEREALLADLEEDAYRKGIPAGWLRCQFE
ncbi:MAG: hypothetical protein HZB33_12790 [Nitrospirae bacterium]|nr:hypothetical protein [Nitrospirota bacterium]